ncbi:MAG: hypothetical protein ACP5VQ_09235 [Phycisphaerae bacterium]
MAFTQPWKCFFPTVVLLLGGSIATAASVVIPAPSGNTPVPAAAAAPAHQAPLTTSAVTANSSRGPVFQETLKLFHFGLSPGMIGSIVLGSLKSTADPELTPYFLMVSRVKSPELRLIGLLDANAVSKDSKLIDIPEFLAIPIPRLIGPSLAVLIQSGSISSAQLTEVMNTAIEPSEKLMAASELVNRGQASAAVKVLDELTESPTDSVRYYAALTLLQYHSVAQNRLGLKLLMQLASRRALRLVDLKDALLARAAAQEIEAAATWAVKIAKDPHNPWSLRRRAVQTLLVLGDSSAPSLLAGMIRSAKGTIDKIELGLLAIQYPHGLSAAAVRLLQQPDSPLLTGIAKTAAVAVAGKDPLSGILALIQQGQPIFLNWALAYAEPLRTTHRLTILQALIGYATDAGNGDDTDFHRAMAAATLLANANGSRERKILAADLNSPNAGIVEATLAGMIESHHANFAPLIMPYWKQLLARDHRKIREFAAMELAREGHKVELPILRNIVLYELRRSDGFRAAAGWYYVKITGRGPALLAAVQNSAATRPDHQ